MMKGSEFRSDMARKYFAEGREEGRKQGRKEGREQGYEEGRHAIVDIVCTRLPGLRDELATRLRGQIEAWLTELVVELSNARGEDEVRAVLDRPRRS